MGEISRRPKSGGFADVCPPATPIFETRCFADEFPRKARADARLKHNVNYQNNSFRRCSYTCVVSDSLHYVKLRCHPSVKKNPRGDLFNSPPRASFFSPSGERKGECSARCSTNAQATNQIARCFPVFNAYGKPFNGRSRSFHRQTCTEPAALTDVLQNLRRAVARASP